MQTLSPAITRHLSLTALKLEQLFNFRLILVGAILVLFFFVAIDLWTEISLGLIALLIGMFLYFVKITVKTRLFHTRLTHLKRFIERQDHRFHGRSVTTDLAQVNHDLVLQHQSVINDLDLVGRHSLLSLLDETFSAQGQKILLEWMLEPKLEIQETITRQKTVQSLVKHAGFFRKWSLLGAEAHEKLKNKDSLEFFLKDTLFPTSLKKHYYAILSLFFGFLLCTFFELYMKVNLNPFSQEASLTSWLWLLFFIYNLYGLKQISHVFQKLQDIMLSLEAISPLFQHLEKRHSTKAFQTLLKTIFHARPARQLMRLEQSFSFLSLQTHPLVLFLVHALCPWSIYFVRRAEKDRALLHTHLGDCLQEVYKLEALTSLLFLHKYQTQTYPDFHDECQIQVKQMEHPLLAKSARVNNDFLFKASTRLVLITGSNMAGKSTFLRTLGINQTLAHMGAPVFASAMETKLVPIRSCIRVSDSLREGASYFYAETQRLAGILKEAQSGRPLLYFVDEVFKGTNNRERLIGSQALARELIKTPSFGFITTHDLELTHIAENYKQIENWHFRDDIRDNQMSFSYKILPGPCPTTNALKIMELSGLPVLEKF
ncbi:MAG: hypothetical protein AB7F59_13000 [Bdellovibrionales bacterium]